MAWPILVASGLVDEGDDDARARLGRVLKIMGARIGHLNDIPRYCAAYFSDDYELDAEAAADFDDTARAHMARLADAMEKVEGFDASSAEAALRGITIEAAYSLRLEDEIGSIEPGKRANLTILKDNPLTVDPMKIKDVKIWGTVMEGRILPVGKAERKASLEPSPDGSGQPATAFTYAALDHALKVAHGH